MVSSPSRSPDCPIQSQIPGNSPTSPMCLITLETRGFVTALVCLSFVLCGNVPLTTATGFDTTGRGIEFYPKAIMLSTNPTALVFYQDTTVISLHIDLSLASHINPPGLNLSCDPILSKVDDRVLHSFRAIQRTTKWLFSIHAVTNLLKCNSYLAFMLMFRVLHLP